MPEINGRVSGSGVGSAEVTLERNNVDVVKRSEGALIVLKVLSGCLFGM